MTCEILVRQEPEGFSATLFGLPDCVVQAPTREEVIEKVRLRAQDWLMEVKAGGGEIVQVEIDLPNARDEFPPERRRSFAGMWARDETFEAFVAAMKEYRAQVAADPNEP